MKDNAVLANTARGAIFDEEALVRELETGRIYAALDVYEEESLPVDHKLRSLKNTLLMPHMGGPAIDRRKFVTLALAKDIKEMKEGKRGVFCGLISQTCSTYQTVE